jgi:hypothetical protein
VPNHPNRPDSGGLSYPLPELPEATIVVLPTSVEGEVGVYSNEVSTLAKELRAAGVAAEYLHGADHRQWRVNMGEVPVDIVVGVTSAIIGSGLWDAFVAFLGTRYPVNEVNLRVVRQRRRPNGDRINTTVEISGKGRQLRKLLETALKEDKERG